MASDKSGTNLLSGACRVFWPVDDGSWGLVVLCLESPREEGPMFTLPFSSRLFGDERLTLAGMKLVLVAGNLALFLYGGVSLTLLDEP